MLTHPTLAQLEELGLAGMAKALRELLSSGDAAGLSLTEGLGLLYQRAKKMTPVALLGFRRGPGHDSLLP